MHQPETPLKEIPKNVTRGKVYRWYPKISEKVVREVIKDAIIEVNKKIKTPFKLKTQVLCYHHIKYIVDTLDTPEGFKAIDH